MMSNLISGKVIRGKRLGKVLGFPTINISYHGNLRGVFAGKVFWHQKWHNAALHIGNSPTIEDSKSDQKILVEAYLLDFSKKIEPGEIVEINIMTKIRDIIKFNNLEDLKKQIAEDVSQIRNLLAQGGK